jgi:CPA2 family monovalent cation:H+ antiporter-2
MAEIGVILLMFGVGMHFHPEELLRVWRIAVPGAVAQSAVAGFAGWSVARAFGWSHVAGMVFGMALAVASTVVLMRMLVERDRLASHEGHVAVGWLIVEDLFTVVALVVLPALASGSQDQGGMAKELALAMGMAGLFAVLVWALGTRLVAPLMERVAKMRSRELFTLTVFVIALGVAILAAEVFHVSVALGAFFAGLVVGQSRFGAQAASDMAPFQDVFSALFFVSVGMLFNPALVAEQPVLVLLALAVVLVVKPLVALVIVLLLRDSLRTALTVAVGLAQIGEFSFILAALGQSLGLLPREGMDILVIAAIASIAVNPLLFRALAAWEQRNGMEKTPPAAKHATGAVVLAGGGEIGRRLLHRLDRVGVPFTEISTDPQALEKALPRARVLVVTAASLAEKMRICTAARTLNPRISIIATADSRAERAWLEEFGATYVSDVVEESAGALMRAVRSAL